MAAKAVSAAAATSSAETFCAIGGPEARSPVGGTRSDPNSAARSASISLSPRSPTGASCSVWTGGGGGGGGGGDCTTGVGGGAGGSTGVGGGGGTWTTGAGAGGGAGGGGAATAGSGAGAGASTTGACAATSAGASGAGASGEAGNAACGAAPAPRAGLRSVSASLTIPPRSSIDLASITWLCCTSERRCRIWCQSSADDSAIERTRSSGDCCSPGWRLSIVMSASPLGNLRRPVARVGQRLRGTTAKRSRPTTEAEAFSVPVAPRTTRAALRLWRRS